MDVEYPGYGAIVVEGKRFEHDVVVEAGEVRRRDKGPSKARRGQYGHTPLSAGEEIPWSLPRLVIWSISFNSLISSVYNRVSIISILPRMLTIGDLRS